MPSPHAVLAHPFSLTIPHRLTEISSWHEHIPFGFALVAASRPRVLVELGTHRGDSFCAFCQAVDGLALPTRCYAVDTWQGDEQAGRYGEDVLEELRNYHDQRYGRFSQLVRSTFDEARSYFADGSVDLLHIDGLHTREAVAHDYESWKPKLSDRAIVLFHDINVRERDFGVWSLWDELSNKFPSFTFVHGHGLGLLAVGAHVPAEVLQLCALPEAEQVVIRERFSTLGNRVGLMGQLDLARQRLREAGARRQALEVDAVRAREELDRRERMTRQIEASATDLEHQLRLANEETRVLRERAQANDEAMLALQKEVERLGSLIVEGNRTWLDRLVGWVRRKNRIRLARRRARRGELPPGRERVL